jgi:glycosyltransferase involved in cell wall biosynthesis
VYLVCSREEGGPKAVLEAMATGIPLVSTRVGQASEIIENGHNAFLAEVEDCEALAFHLLQISENPDLSKKLRDNALKTVGKYSYSALAGSFEGFFKTLR